MKVLTMQLNSTSVMDIVAYGGAAIGMAVAVTEFLHGNLNLSGTLCIVLLSSEFFLPLRLISDCGWDRCLKLLSRLLLLLSESVI